MSSIYSSILKLFNSQEEFLKETVASRSMGLGMLGYVMGAFCVTFYANFYSGASVLSFVAQFFVYLAAMIVLSLVFASITQLFLDLIAREGNAPGLFALIGISEFAKVLLIAGLLMTGAVKNGAALASVVAVVTFIFQLVFLTVMISRAYTMPKGLVLLSFVITMVPAVMACVLMFITAAAGIVALIMGLAA
ncbi:hypothetical protein AAIR98_000323 [Elusimicrobium simillimum]|uniref:hypothetical protein n=1 Tax=Elusimicrobium simillimum TaxID=3143438 RepID=UPI003C700C44